MLCNYLTTIRINAGKIYLKYGCNLEAGQCVSLNGKNFETHFWTLDTLQSTMCYTKE